MIGTNENEAGDATGVQELKRELESLKEEVKALKETTVERVRSDRRNTRKLFRNIDHGCSVSIPSKHSNSTVFI